MNDNQLKVIGWIRSGMDFNTAYINSWIRTFKDDPKVPVLAAAQAQKSVDYIQEHQSNGQP